MSYEYASRRRAGKTAAQKESAPAQPSLDALRAGAAKPTAAQKGHRVDLPDAMRTKMENAFGADLSAVKLYESEAVADAGANAVTQGSEIAFAPGMLDFSSYGGQALLGHELSHVVSQARGEVTGGGFLNDHALEARADREGAMAAAGQTVTAPTAAMSDVSAAPAAGPMQADKKERNLAQANEISHNYDRWKGLESSLTIQNAGTIGPQMDKAQAAFEEAARGSSRGARKILANRLKTKEEAFNSMVNNYMLHNDTSRDAAVQHMMANPGVGGRLQYTRNLMTDMNAARKRKR